MNGLLCGGVVVRLYFGWVVNVFGGVCVCWCIVLCWCIVVCWRIFVCWIMCFLKSICVLVF